MAKAVGSQSVENFHLTGSIHLSVLKSIGLKNGMTIYDLGCGSGRTALALKREGWHGNYIGHDIIPELVEYAKSIVSDSSFKFYVHQDLSLKAQDNSIDIIFAWSVFTHLYLEESFLYILDCYRALKKDGILIFSFLDLETKQGIYVLNERTNAIKNKKPLVHLDIFMSRAIIEKLSFLAEFSIVKFINGDEKFWTIILLDNLLQC
jgi:ubiquinone/menaquinone biosynthesis C-methylase UbiE